MSSQRSSPLQNKIAAITGASSGIGEAIAKALALEGVKVALGARRLEKLEEVKKQIASSEGSKTASVIYCDVVSRESVKHFILEAEQQLGGPIDILINNAGIMPLTFMKNVREDEWEQMVDVNIKGVLNGIGAVLPGMLLRKSGDIVNISSDAGRKVFPGAAVYCGTKWAVEGITQGLRMEIAGSGVRCLSIQPGATATELGSHIKDPDVIEASKSLKLSFLQAEDVANAVVYALKQPKHASVNEVLIRPESQGI